MDQGSDTLSNDENAQHGAEKESKREKDSHRADQRLYMKVIR